MQNQAPLTIYNASAGSGKTYTLVKDYLKILYNSKSNLAFRNTLALTFTNKAVGEMKERIITMLKRFSEDDIHTLLHLPMFSDLVKALEIDPETLQNKSKILLQSIVHNYAAYDISTIDKFNHKLIRTFAYDLKLPLNFEVELDTDTLLAKAVDKLIDQAGADPKLTKVLIDFAIEKTDEDKSWNIAYDFNEIAKVLVNENDIPYLEELKHKTLTDFEALKHHLQNSQKDTSAMVVEVSQQVLWLIEDATIQHDDFNRSSLPKHFIKLSNKEFDVSFSSNWQNDLLEGSTLHPKRVSEDTAVTIESLRPHLIDAFTKTKQAVFQIKFLNNALKNITPLSVLSAIGKTLEELKNEEDLLLISEFNEIINNEIKAQPAPFIYERIGEKFKHYFIDEFQDTSGLQWENLIPLIHSAVSSENLNNESGSAMLVGDAKQAIYRWRGGRAEQFIDLYSEGNPFHVEKHVSNLPTNFRSHKTIVEFNNSFFEHISEFAFSNNQYREIYKNARQNVSIEKPGYVELNFLNTIDEDKNQLQCEAVLTIVQKAIRQGFSYRDICIIVRRKKEGFAIAEYLSDMEIPIISSESLLIKNAPEVQFINQVIAFGIQPDNDEVKVAILAFLTDDKLQLNNKHLFFKGLIDLNGSEFFNKLNTFGFNFDFENFLQLPMYEAVESVVRGFGLNSSLNAYLQFYLDEVFDYSQRHGANINGFLEYWERKKDSLSIVSPTETNAIQVMTIHKSKGLEFPVVIFPYANQDIYSDISPKVWFPVDPKSFHGFSHLYLNMNKDLEELGDLGHEIYNSYRSKLELDSLNLLYVVLTRAAEQLYIISEKDLDKKTQSEKLTYYSGLFINYLKSLGQWDNDQNSYSFGDPTKTSEEKIEVNHTITQACFISTEKEAHNLNIVTNSGYLWDTAQEHAIERGNLVHNILSYIKTPADIDFALSNFLDSGQINNDQLLNLKSLITRIVEHDQLASVFDETLSIYNERDIISKDGQILRPDRVVVNSKNQAIIIDYKTGREHPKHKEQLYNYQDLLEEMNLVVIKKILVYINDNIVVKEF